MSGDSTSGLPARRANGGRPSAGRTGTPAAAVGHGTPRFLLRIEGHGPRIHVRVPLLPVAILVSCVELVAYPLVCVAAPRIARRCGHEGAAQVLRELPAFPLSKIMGTLMRGGPPLEVSVDDGSSRFHLRLG